MSEECRKRSCFGAHSRSNRFEKLARGFRCATHFRTYFSGDWDVHWGYGVLTHGHMSTPEVKVILPSGASETAGNSDPTIPHHRNQERHDFLVTPR